MGHAVLHLLSRSCHRCLEVNALGLFENMETCCFSNLEKATEITGCRVTALTATDVMNLDNILVFPDELSVRDFSSNRIIVYWCFRVWLLVVSWRKFWSRRIFMKRTWNGNGRLQRPGILCSYVASHAVSD